MFETQQMELLTSSPLAELSEQHVQTSNRERLDSRPLPVRRALTKIYEARLERHFSESRRMYCSDSEHLAQNESLYNHYHELLETHLQNDTEIDILEVGCGSGKFCHTLVEKGYRAFGIDLSHVLLQQAREIAPGCNFERASAYEPYDDLFGLTFDAILYLDAIEHLHSPRRFLMTAVESLKPGGLLIVSARYQRGLMSMTGALTGHSDFEDEILLQNGSCRNGFAKCLRQVLEDYGLKVVESQTAECLPRPGRSQLLVARKPVPITPDPLGWLARTLDQRKRKKQCTERACSN